MVGTGLTLGGERAPVRIELVDPERASGLADMLHQLVEQTVAADPAKARAARAIDGQVVFRAAEDREVCVTMTFGGGRIELRDGAPAVPAPAIWGDFLTIAHLASGEESALRLLVSGRLRVHHAARLAHLVLLWRVADLLRIERARWRAPALVLVVVALVAIAVVVWLVLGGREGG